MFTMRFYDYEGNTAGEVTGLTWDEVMVVYHGCRTILKREGNSMGFNLWMPTVWDEETGDRVAGY